MFGRKRRLRKALSVLATTYLAEPSEPARLHLEQCIEELPGDSSPHVQRAQELLANHDEYARQFFERRQKATQLGEQAKKDRARHEKEMWTKRLGRCACGSTRFHVEANDWRFEYSLGRVRDLRLRFVCCEGCGHARFFYTGNHNGGTTIDTNTEVSPFR